jgi:hypothetical protein
MALGADQSREGGAGVFGQSIGTAPCHTDHVLEPFVRRLRGRGLLTIARVHGDGLAHNL